MKDEKVIEMENNEVEEIEEVEETKLDKIKNSKPVSFIKKHGKKLAVGAAIGAAFLIGRALAKDDGLDLGSFDDSDDDRNVVDLTDDDYEVSETESTEENE